jgi:hypothetical protein
VFRMSVRTAECHSPQSCFPVSNGISLVEGNVNFEGELYVLDEAVDVRKTVTGGTGKGGERIECAGIGMGWGAIIGIGAGVCMRCVKG